MTLEAQYNKMAGEVEVPAPEALSTGEVIQLADGRAAFYPGSNSASSGDTVTLKTCGRVFLQKTASISILEGGKVYWVRSTSKAHPLKEDGDFYVGVCVEDAASGDSTVEVELNTKPRYQVGFPAAFDEDGGTWQQDATDGLGVTIPADGCNAQLAFDAVAEVAQAALYSDDSVAVADGPIFEGRVAIFDVGDDAALDINIGLANGSHATDFDSVTEAVVIHLDGNALDVKAESDDGTTEVAATDTTVNAVDDTYFEIWIDCRDPSDCKIYLDGVRVLSGTAFDISAATGPLKPIAHMEKTSNDTPADLRIDFMRVRTTDLTS